MPKSGDSIRANTSHSTAIRPADERAVLEAGALIRSGCLVAFPTETVYGLGADAANGEAVARIFAAKGRPTFNPLIVHVPNIAEALQLADFSKTALLLAKQFWPGPLTLVLPRRSNCGISELATAGLTTIAIRVPAHPIAQALLQAAKRPLAAPSANRSGHVSATRAEHVAEDLGGSVAMILNGGASLHGLESTVIDANGENVILLRPGAIPIGALEATLTRQIARSLHTSDAIPASPGRLESHYAPQAAVRLNARHVNTGEALLAFGPDVPKAFGPVFNLSLSGNLIEAAAQLYEALRSLDATGMASIAVMPIPNHGVGEAINDRLQRAAAPRSR